jgi:hypothetical protein
MSDEYQQVRNIFEFIKENLTILNDKDKAIDLSIKALVRNSLLERVLAKFFFQYRSKEYDLYNILSYFKENTENSDNNTDNSFTYIKDQFNNFLKMDFKTGPLMFYQK